MLKEEAEDEKDESLCRLSSHRVLRLYLLVMNVGWLTSLSRDSMDCFRTVAKLSRTLLAKTDASIRGCLNNSYPRHDLACHCCGVKIAGVMMIQAGQLLHFGCCRPRVDKRWCRGSVARATRYAGASVSLDWEAIYAD